MLSFIILLPIILTKFFTYVYRRCQLVALQTLISIYGKQTYCLFVFFRIIAILGLLFISIGTGAIKPCIFPFGADQFCLPQQEKELINYTTIFVVVVKFSSLISTFVMPELRHNVHCFGKDSCFPLAFGLPTGMMFFAIGN